MSDFAPLGSLSMLDELGPTEMAWQPYAFRTSRSVPRQPSSPPERETLPAAELA